MLVQITAANERATLEAADEDPSSSRPPSPSLLPPLTDPAEATTAPPAVFAPVVLLGRPVRQPLATHELFRTYAHDMMAYAQLPGISDNRRLAALWESCTMDAVSQKKASAETAAWRTQRAAFRRSAGWRRQLLLDEGWKQSRAKYRQAQSELRYLRRNERFGREDWAATVIQRALRKKLYRRRKERELHLQMEAVRRLF